MGRRDQNLIHGDLKEFTEGIEVVHTGEALSFLPLVDCLRLFKTEKPLEIPDGKATLLPQPGNICPSCHGVDYRESHDRHKTASILVGWVDG